MARSKKKPNASKPSDKPSKKSSASKKTKKSTKVKEASADYDVDGNDADTSQEAAVPEIASVEFQPDPKLSPFENTAAKVRTFPQSPGVYLMKDAAGVVIYVGKATSLRSRAGSYFLKAALVDQRTANWVPSIAAVSYTHLTLPTIYSV